MTHSVSPTQRHAIISGRTLLELIRGVLDQRIGHVAEIISVEAILLSLLEEYFYGGTFQDEFYEQLSAYRIPSDMIQFTRREILRSIGEQIQLVFSDIRPCNTYTFELVASGDIRITEETPRLRFPVPRLVTG